VATVTVAAAVAVPSDVAVADPDATDAAACSAETKRLKSFKRG
jgi:hypothetical protein